MSQLLIVDIQKTYSSSKELDKKVLEYSENFNSVIYIYDTIFGPGNDCFDMWDNMKKSYQEEVFEPIVVEKQFNFFRKLMDNGYSDDFIISLIKLMMRFGYKNGCEFSMGNDEASSELLRLYEKYKEPVIDFNDYYIYIPDVLWEIKDVVKNGVVLVGGEKQRCLKEISLLLSIIDINYVVKDDLTY